MKLSATTTTRLATAVLLGLTAFRMSVLPAAAQSPVTIYNVTAAGASDTVPFENDGTPNRPAGDHLGNTITFAGTARYLTHVQVVFGSHGPKESDTYNLTLYKNDGPREPRTGLSQPGTRIASFQAVARNQPLPGNGAYGVDWNFAPTLVPDTVTAIVSSTYSTATPGQFMGPYSVVTPPLTGNVLNTIWYGDGKPGHWVSNDQWAIADGAKKNSFDMRFDAVSSPKPAQTPK